VVWDDVEKRWYHLYPDQDLPPGDGYHWRGPYKTWNARCAECHATNYQRNYGARTQSYASTQPEIGVGCEACHGPGAAHLDWVAGRPVETPGLTERGFTIDLGADVEATMQVCAACHSRREPLLDGNPVPGTPYHDAHALSLLRPGLYHADGQILDEAYVYGSFLQSKMYARGVGCWTVTSRTRPRSRRRTTPSVRNATRWRATRISPRCGWPSMTTRGTSSSPRGATARNAWPAT